MAQPNALQNTAVITMSSREIAELTGKEHKNVVRDVRVMLQELELDRLSFERIYKDGMNRDQTEYLLDRELTQTLLTGYSIPLRHRVIARLNELERPHTPRTPQNYIEALRLAADQAEQIQHQQAVIEEQAPKVEAMRVLADAEGSVCITVAAKQLSMKPGALFTWLKANRWIYRRTDNGPFVAYQPRIDSGLLVHKVEVIEREGKQDKLVENVRVTPKGLAKLALAVGGDV